MSEIKNFEYCVPTNVIFGRDTHKDTGKIIKNYGFKKIMLHYGMGSVKKSGLYDEIVKSLNENGIDFTELGGAEPNPKIGLVREGVSVCKRENVEMILAVGGGSVIDSAKVMAIAALSDYDARANLMWAGSLSHNGITGLGTAHFMECHQIEHELSGMFDSVAHGAGLAVIFPAWAKYILKYNVDRFFEFAVNIWGINPYGKEKYDVAMLGIEKCEEFFKSIGMPVKLNELNIDVSDGQIEEMAEKCTFFGKRTLPDYIELGKKEIIDIYNLAK